MDGVRVTDAHQRQSEGHAIHVDAQVGHRAGAIDSRGKGGWIEVRRPHVDPSRRYGPVFTEELKGEHARQRFDGYVVRIRRYHAFFDRVLCEAADAVSAHLCLGAVGVEHAHAQIGDV